VLKKSLLLAILLASLPALATETDLWIESRGIRIPVTLTMPGDEPGVAAPVVVLVHGHGGTRQENGAFTELASMLADLGIASIRMDFPGCGDSTEAFTRNNITRMLHDVDAAFEFAVAQAGIDRDRVGILGYSMGGRLAMLAIGDEPAYQAAVLWAPVALNGSESMVEYFGGRESYETIRKEAQTKGHVIFTAPWGQEQQLGEEFFDDLERSEPLAAFARYRGDLLVVHGSADQAIHVDNGRIASQAALSAASAELKIIRGAGHGFGFFGDQPDVRAEVLGATVDFFAAQLLHD
jgi:dipeptidyl aminopeptidase/acylaminoacyl peptidase